MIYWTLAAVVTLTSLAVAAVAAAVVVALAAPWAMRGVATLAPAARARVLFLLRVLPGVTAVVAAFGVALPIFLWFEADNPNESIGPTLAASTALGAWMVWRGVAGVAAARRATLAVTGAWLRRGRRVHDLTAPFPTYAIDEAFPIVAVAGVHRPVLFIAERVLAECPPAEVQAMLAHECAHVGAWDNVKRAAIRACPALLAAHDDLERAWRRAAEEAADARAAGARGESALDLAQALVHVARLAQADAPPLASAFYAGGGIEDRVRLLLGPPAAPASRRGVVALSAVAAGAAALGAAALQVAPADIHVLFERAIALLP